MQLQKNGDAFSWKLICFSTIHHCDLMICCVGGQHIKWSLWRGDIFRFQVFIGLPEGILMVCFSWQLNLFKQHEDIIRECNDVFHLGY